MDLSPITIYLDLKAFHDAFEESIVVQDLSNILMPQLGIKDIGDVTEFTKNAILPLFSRFYG